MKKKLIIISTILLLVGCASNSKIEPSYTFKMSETACKETECTGNSILTRHPTSSIDTEAGSVIRLSVEAAYLTELSEKSATSAGQVGNRELMLYAIIYKNGHFQRYKKITDIAEHVATYQPVIVQNPIFFTETIDANYHIILKGYEVDTKTLVKALRRVRSTDVESIESSSFSPGDTFTSGLKDVVFGLFDIVLSVTGKSLDDWAANANATKVFEHSIYVTPGLTDKGVNKLLVLGSGSQSFFVKTEETKDSDIKETKDSDIKETKDSDAKKITDSDINKYVRGKIEAIEAESFNDDDLMMGKNGFLSGSPYLILKAERLTP